MASITGKGPHKGYDLNGSGGLRGGMIFCSLSVLLLLKPVVYWRSIRTGLNCSERMRAGIGVMTVI